MSARIWIWVGALVAIPAAGIVIITSIPRDGVDGIGSVDGDFRLAAGADEPVGGSTPAAAPVPIADERLADDVEAFAWTRQPDLPLTVPGADIPVTLVTVDTDGVTLSLVHRVEVDALNYEVPSHRSAVVPGLDALECDEYACFEFTPDFVTAICADAALASLLLRGATAIFSYRDVNDEELGRIAVSGQDCTGRDDNPHPVAPAAAGVLLSQTPAPDAGEQIVGLAAPIPGDGLPTPREPSESLHADLVAYMNRVQDGLPRVEGNVSLDSISLVGNQLHFVETIQIDLADYGYAYDPELLGPQLLGWSCDGSMCFKFTDDYARDTCRSEVASLISRGAVAVHVYRDLRGRFMGEMAVSDADCAAIAVGR